MVDVPTPPFGSSVTAEFLRDRMLDSMASNLDRSEGSLAFSLIMPFAIELDRLYDQLDIALALGFVQSTSGGFLDARAEEHGLLRRPAQKAVGEVTFTGTNGTIVPAGTSVSTVGSAGSPAVTFVTTESGTIASGVFTADIEAVEAGFDGNVPVGAITQLVGFVSGVTSLSNAVETAGGADEETDDLFRERIIEVVAGATGAGTADDYEQWALEVPGVGSAVATPLASGPGTVTVTILDADGDPASAGLISAVDAYIDTLSPIGASVTVNTPAAVTVNVSVNVTPAVGLTEALVEDGIEAAVAAYFDTLRPGDDVIFVEVGAAVVTAPGVADYASLQLNGTGANVAISAAQVASLGTVTVT